MQEVIKKLQGVLEYIHQNTNMVQPSHDQPPEPVSEFDLDLYNIGMDLGRAISMLNDTAPKELTTRQLHNFMFEVESDFFGGRSIQGQTHDDYLAYMMKIKFPNGIKLVD